MTGVLAELTRALAGGSVRVVDLTAPLSERTPLIELPPDRGQAWPFRRTPISHYDAVGPEAYWNNFSCSEHTGTHFDAPVHWISGKGLDDVASVPAHRLMGPAAVLDFSPEAAADPGFLLQRHHVEAWEADHGALPEDGWLLYRTGWDRRVDDPASFLNDGRSPGVAPGCARWLAEDTPIVGIGVETVGTDAGQAASFDRPFPCHWYFCQAGKYGLTQLQRLAELPPQGALVIAGPLPIVEGSGSPARVLALVEG